MKPLSQEGLNKCLPQPKTCDLVPDFLLGSSAHFLPPQLQQLQCAGDVSAPQYAVPKHWWWSPFSLAIWEIKYGEDENWLSIVDLGALAASILGCISYLKHLTCWIHCIFHPSCWLRYFHNVHADYFNLCLAVLKHLLSCSQQLPLLPKRKHMQRENHAH